MVTPQLCQNKTYSQWKLAIHELPNTHTSSGHLKTVTSTVVVDWKQEIVDKTTCFHENLGCMPKSDS